MAVETSDLVRPRGVFEVLDDALDRYRDAFVLYVCLAGLIGVPAYLVYLPAVSYANDQLQQRLSESGDALGAAVQLLLVTAVVGGPILEAVRVLQATAIAEAVRQ